MATRCFRSRARTSMPTRRHAPIREHLPARHVTWIGDARDSRVCSLVLIGVKVTIGPLLRGACLIALVPSLALAQRGMGGMGGMGSSNGIARRRPGNIEREPGLVVPKQVNAVNLLIEHRQDLA